MNKIKNSTILKFGSIAIVLLFIVNIVYYMQLRIDEPVFLRHYYELYIQNGTFLNIYYISDSANEREIYRIEFPQMPEEFAYLSNNGMYSEGFGKYERAKFAHYKFNNIMGTLYYDPETESENLESVVLDKAIIYYSNGEKQEVDIGKIILHKNYKHDSFIDNAYNSSSSDFTSSTGIRPTKDITIMSITSELDDETNGFLRQTLNGVDFFNLIFPMKAKAGDNMDIESKFLYNTNDIRKYNAYEVQQTINAMDEEGNIVIKRILNINYEPTEAFLKESGIIQYLKVRGIL